jgi:hypothetical protein
MSGSAYDGRRDAGPTELAAFQSALARLQPAPDEINIAQLMFQAGQLSARRRRWAWPCATAASILLAAALGSVLLLRPTLQPAERIVTVYVPAPTAPQPQPESTIPSTGETPIPPPLSAPGGDESDYLRLRREVLFHGLDALPPSPPWSAAAPVDNADTLLDLPRDSHEPWLLRLKSSLQSGGSS